MKETMILGLRRCKIVDSIYMFIMHTRNTYIFHVGTSLRGGRNLPKGCSRRGEGACRHRGRESRAHTSALDVMHHLHQQQPR